MDDSRIKKEDGIKMIMELNAFTDKMETIESARDIWDELSVSEKMRLQTAHMIVVGQTFNIGR